MEVYTMVQIGGGSVLFFSIPGCRADVVTHVSCATL